jgi:hypothetical protein
MLDGNSHEFGERSTRLTVIGVARSIPLPSPLMVERSMAGSRFSTTSVVMASATMSCSTTPITTALRTEDRHGIHELAEDHFDGPGQRADGSELRRGQRQRLLDPESLGDGDEPERTIGVINHEQRQIAEPHGADWRNKRRLEPVPDESPAVRRGGLTF